MKHLASKCSLILLTVILAAQAQAFDAQKCRSLFNEESYSQALGACRAGSINGDAESKYYLSKMYIDGLGVEKNLNIGFKLMDSAAYLSHPAAMVQLGAMYWNGSYVDKDSAKACNWWERAANVGHATGQEKYGVCFMLGRGREKDIARAYSYLQEAANNGSASAVYIVNRYKELFPSEMQSLSTAD